MCVCAVKMLILTGSIDTASALRADNVLCTKNGTFIAEGYLDGSRSTRGWGLGRSQRMWILKGELLSAKQRDRGRRD